MDALYVLAMLVGSRYLYLKRFDPTIFHCNATWTTHCCKLVTYQYQKNKTYETFFFCITWNLFNALLDYLFLDSTDSLT